MNADHRSTAALIVALALAYPWAPGADAAPPPGKGNNTEPTESVAGAAPEFYRVEFDFTGRNLTLQGVRFITGSMGAPVFPSGVVIGGQSVAIDPASAAAAASVSATDFNTGEGPLILPFDDVLTALEGPPSPPSLRTLEGERNFEIKVTTVDGTAAFSAYFPRDIKEIPADVGVCPCTFAIYDATEAQAGTIACSAAEGIPPGQYIEAGYGKVDGSGNISAVIIGSHSSGSTEPLYESSCYTRDLSQIVGGVETPVYLEGPIPVGNVDHQLCVAAIESIEPACSP